MDSYIIQCIKAKGNIILHCKMVLSSIAESYPAHSLGVLELDNKGFSFTCWHFFTTLGLFFLFQNEAFLKRIMFLKGSTWLTLKLWKAWFLSSLHNRQ